MSDKVEWVILGTFEGDVAEWFYVEVGTPSKIVKSLGKLCRKYRVEKNWVEMTPDSPVLFDGRGTSGKTRLRVFDTTRPDNLAHFKAEWGRYAVYGTAAKRAAGVQMTLGEGA